MRDRMWRVLFRVAFQLVRVWWFVARPHAEGVFAAVWWEDRLLLIRNSYRTGESTPGGRLGRGEPPLEGARRELREEVGLDLPQSEFRFACELELVVDFVHDTVSFFEVALDREPVLRVDRREVVWAGFVAADELSSRPLSPHARAYLRQRDSRTGP